MITARNSIRMAWRVVILYIAIITSYAASQSVVWSAGPITALAVSPDNSRVLLGSQNGIEIRSLPELNLIGKIETKLRHVHDLRFSPNGTVLLAAGGIPAEEGSVETIDWPSRQVTKTVSLHQDLIYRVAWSMNGTQWATASADGMCKIIDSKSLNTISSYSGHSRSAVGIEFLPGGYSVASVGVDNTIQIWDHRNGTRIRSLDNHVGPINGIALNPNLISDQPRPEAMATVSEDRTVRLWQPSIGRLMRFSKLPSVPRVVAWTTDEENLLVGCNDGIVRLLEVESLVEIGQRPGGVGRIYELAPIGPTATVIAAGADGVSVIDFGSLLSR